MIFEELIHEFTRCLGWDETLKPDDAGMISLTIDDMPVTIMGIDDLSTVTLSGVIDALPQEGDLSRLYRGLLEANSNFHGTAGATLAIDPATACVTLCRILPLQVQDGETFLREVEHFVNTLATWQWFLREYQTQDDTEPRPTTESPNGEMTWQV